MDITVLKRMVCKNITINEYNYFIGVKVFKAFIAKVKYVQLD